MRGKGVTIQLKKLIMKLKKAIIYLYSKDNCWSCSKKAKYTGNLENAGRQKSCGWPKYHLHGYKKSPLWLRSKSKRSPGCRRICFLASVWEKTLWPLKIWDSNPKASKQKIRVVKASFAIKVYGLSIKKMKRRKCWEKRNSSWPRTPTSLDLNPVEFVFRL